MSHITELGKEMRQRFGAAQVKIQHGPVVDSVYYNIPDGIKISSVRKFAKQNDMRAGISLGTEGMVLEVPRTSRQVIFAKDLLESAEYKKSNATLPIPLGVDPVGKPVIYDLEKMRIC